MGFLDATGITTLVEKLKDKFALKAEVSNKQDALVSGTNIKTVNGNSLLGSGNVQISYPSMLPSSQIRLAQATHKASDTGYKYRIWLTSADGTMWVPINTSSSTRSSTEKTLNTRPIDPFGPIIYFDNNGSTTSGNDLTVDKIWMKIGGFMIGYSYAISLTQRSPIYLKCTPQANGSAVMNVITQTLPSSNDGYIYIFLGVATSSTAMELYLEHPVYYHDGTGIRLWTGATSGGSNGWTDISNAWNYTGIDNFVAITDGHLVVLSGSVIDTAPMLATANTNYAPYGGMTVLGYGVDASTSGPALITGELQVGEVIFSGLENIMAFNITYPIAAS